jgi:hypothetical protein
MYTSPTGSRAWMSGPRLQWLKCDLDTVDVLHREHALAITVDDGGTMTSGRWDSCSA